jgi:hypothetical protein
MEKSGLRSALKHLRGPLGHALIFQSAHLVHPQKQTPGNKVQTYEFACSSRQGVRNHPEADGRNGAGAALYGNRMPDSCGARGRSCGAEAGMTAVGPWERIEQRFFKKKAVLIERRPFRVYCRAERGDLSPSTECFD